MQIEILPDEETLARRGSALIAAAARQAIDARGLFLIAVSGGKNPWQMFRFLADETLPWDKVHVMQVDERVAPDGDPARNFTHLQSSLLSYASLDPEHVYRMPVTEADLDKAASHYACAVHELAGPDPIIDLVHLGLGPDGHTASLVPGDPVLDVTDRDVAVTGMYQGHRRMTLTFPILNRARHILWLITGDSKAAMVPRLCSGDATIPAGRIHRDHAHILLDQAAGALVKPTTRPN